VLGYAMQRRNVMLVAMVNLHVESGENADVQQTA